MVNRDPVHHATYLYPDRFRICFQEKLGPFLQITGLVEQIHPRREESPVGEPDQDKRVPTTKRNDT